MNCGNYKNPTLSPLYNLLFDVRLYNFDLTLLTFISTFVDYFSKL